MNEDDDRRWVDAKGGGVRAREGREEGDTSKLPISGTGVLHVQEISLKAIRLHASTRFPRHIELHMYCMLRRTARAVRKDSIFARISPFSHRDICD